MNKSNIAILMLCALAASAQAADTETACRLRGGSIVPLPAEACAKEGGTMVTVTVAAPAAGAGQKAAPAPAPVYQLSSDPRLAAAQKPVLELLNKPVLAAKQSKLTPEGVEREAKFAECKLTVEENLHLDYGNLFSARKDFKIGSAVDFRAIKPEDVSVYGEISSKGGYLSAQAVQFEVAQKRSDALTVSISQMYSGKYRKFTSPDSAPYWDAPRDDFWMIDDYGYVVLNRMGNFNTDKVRVLYLLSTPEEAAALKKAFDDVAAVCSQGKAQ